jgi:tRNA threonylcarbamoyladenosine modification (KEOPS) complex Cgi121 subunit
VLKLIEEFKTYAEICGFKNVKISQAKEFLDKVSKAKPAGVEVQFFDARRVASWQHLYFAALNALTAFKNKENISKSLAMETLLYAAAERQITRAVELVGIGATSSDVAVLIIGKEPRKMELTLSMVSKNIGGQRDEKVLELSTDKVATIQRVFDISEAELRTVMEKNDADKAMIDLVVERMALLSTQR